MGYKKLSVSIPEDVAEAATQAAAQDGIGLSAWLAQAARVRLERQRALDDGYRAARELIAEYQARHGTDVTPQARAWSDAVLAPAANQPGRYPDPGRDSPSPSVLGGSPSPSVLGGSPSTIVTRQ